MNAARGRLRALRRIAVALTLALLWAAPLQRASAADPDPVQVAALSEARKVLLELPARLAPLSPRHLNFPEPLRFSCKCMRFNPKCWLARCDKLGRTAAGISSDYDCRSRFKGGGVPFKNSFTCNEYTYQRALTRTAADALVQDYEGVVAFAASLQRLEHDFFRMARDALAARAQIAGVVVDLRKPVAATADEAETRRRRGLVDELQRRLAEEYRRPDAWSAQATQLDLELPRRIAALQGALDKHHSAVNATWLLDKAEAERQRDLYCPCTVDQSEAADRGINSALGGLQTFSDTAKQRVAKTEAALREAQQQVAKLRGWLTTTQSLLKLAVDRGASFAGLVKGQGGAAGSAVLRNLRLNTVQAALDKALSPYEEAVAAWSQVIALAGERVASYRGETPWCASHGPSLPLQPRERNACFLAGISGPLKGGTDAVLVRSEDSRWTLGGYSRQGSLCGTAGCALDVADAGDELIACTTASVRTSSASVLLGAASDRACFLTGITGDTDQYYRGPGGPPSRQKGAFVRLWIDGGQWQLIANSNYGAGGALCGRARCVSGASYTEEREWCSNDPPVRLADDKDHACFLTGLGGGFAGLEGAWIYRDGGAFYLAGQGILHNCAWARCMKVAGAPVAAASDPVVDRALALRPLHSNRCVDVKDGATGDGSRLHQWECAATISSQRFVLKPQGDGTVVIHALASGRCVDVTASDRAGTEVQIWTCNGTTAQRFTMSAHSDGSYSFQNVRNKLCLSLHERSLPNGAPIRQGPCDRNADHRFLLAPR